VQSFQPPELARIAADAGEQPKLNRSARETV
jgi:hypothetical protein